MKKSVAVLLSLLMMFSLMPSALATGIKNGPTKDWTVPEGYNEDDYNAIASFLETEDENGVKNGSWFPDYDVNDPSTWIIFDDDGGAYCILWSSDYEYDLVDGEERLVCVSLPNQYYPFISIYPEYTGMVGSLDLRCCHYLEFVNVQGTRVSELLLPPEVSDIVNIAESCVTEIDLSMCSQLLNFDGFYYAWHDQTLDHVDFSGCTSLGSIDLDSSNVSYVNVAGLENLFSLNLRGNHLTELDLSGCSSLIYLNCAMNELKQIDTSDCISIPIDLIEAEGSGFVGINYSNYSAFLFAEPEDGAEFLGWYTEEGEYLSAEAYGFDIMDFIGTETVFIARFAEVEPVVGDIDGDGEVSMADALMALRAGMELIELTPEQAEAADVNGDGEVDLVDALIILRISMGIA